MKTVENGRELSLQFLKKHGYLSSAWSAGGIKWTDGRGNEADIRFQVDRTDVTNPHIRLIYKTRGSGEDEWRDIDYVVTLESMSCNFGGKRWFFRCGLYKNNRYCGRRVRSLFSVGDYFGCRHCAGLVYYSQTQPGNGPYRWMSRHFDAQDYYDKKVKREYYAGKPTKRYQTYLNMLSRVGFDIQKADQLIEEML